jgi:hypothetical protein
MKHAALVLLGLTSAGSLLALAWVLGRSPAPDPRLAVLETELSEAKRTIASLKRELERRAEQPPPAPVAAAPALAAPAEAAAAATGKGGLREMMNAPGMREAMERQQALQIDIAYAKLFDQLQLSPQEREHFKKLLVERQKTQTELSLKLMDDKLTSAQRQAIGQQIDQQRTAFDETIRQFLNHDDDWQSFQQWEKTLPERTQYEMLGKGLFASSPEPLSTQQEQQLIDLMAEVRARPGSGGNLAGKTNLDPSLLTEELIKRQLQQIEVNGRIVAERAAEFLTPAQLQTLKAYQEQTASMTKTGIEVSKMLFPQKQ